MRLLRGRLGAGLVAAAASAIALVVALNLMPDRRELRAPVPHAMPAAAPGFAPTMHGLFGGGLAVGNAVATLSNGDEIFPAMLEAIDGAEATINFETYVYWSGEIAETFAGRLAARAREGVEVRVLLDWQGSVPMEQRLVDAMVDAGVLVERFRPIRWYTLDRINNRTHRKILVADGRVGFTGGVGIGDEWLGDARHPGEWRETHYRIEGPAVAGLQGAFAENWIEATGELLQGTAFFPPLEPAGDLAAQVVKSSTGERNAMHLVLMTALAAAEQRIRIATPYFVPDEIAKATLIAARGRGVEVDVLVPGAHINKEVVRRASRQSWGALLEAGVRIHEFSPTMYHAKLVVVDEAWATVGSANFDERSFRLNDEANVAVHDAGFARTQAAMFDADLARADEVTLADWQARPLRDKVLDWLWSWLGTQF